MCYKNVTNTSVPSMEAATMDTIVQDVVLPSKATAKVPSNLMEKTLETRRFATVISMHIVLPPPLFIAMI